MPTFHAIIGAMPRTLGYSWLLLASAVSCTSYETPRKASPVASVEPSPAPLAADASPAVPRPEASPASTPPPAPTPSTPPPIDPSSGFAAAVTALLAGAAPSLAADSQAWTDYRAGRFLEAQRGFARVALADLQPWKHPFNLACAAARGEDDAMARVGLREAVRRGGEAAAAKARRDSDLERLRGASWFEPVLRGEDREPASIATNAPDPGVPTELPPAAAPVADVAAADAPVADIPAVPPAPPAPPAPAAPVGPPAPPEPAALPGATGATLTAVAKPEKAAIAAALAVHHGVKVAVRKTLALPTDAGPREAWVVYEYSRWKKCMATADKKTCRAQLAPSGPDERNEALCTAQWLVRATLGEAVTLSEPTPLEPGCKLARVRALAAQDLDGDGADEILVDVTGEGSYETMREGEAHEYGRIVRVLRRDGSVQLDLKYDDFWTDYLQTTVSGYHFYLTDTDGDARPDLVVQEREIHSDFVAQGALWPGPDEAAEEDPEKLGPVTTKIVRYDPATDTWPGAKWGRR